MTTAAQAAARGAALLDREMPGWADRIDLSELDLASCYRCILGQLYASQAAEHGEPYFTGLHQLGLSSKASKEHGFASEYGADDYRLGERWAAEVLRRVQVPA